MPVLGGRLPEYLVPRKKKDAVSLDMPLAVLRHRRFDPLRPDAPFAFRLSELADLGVGSGRPWEMSVARRLREMGWLRSRGVIRYGVVGNWWCRSTS